MGAAVVVYETIIMLYKATSEDKIYGEKDRVTPVVASKQIPDK
jgi:hypothetical protein